jgi:hypothetical protein
VELRPDRARGDRSPPTGRFPAMPLGMRSSAPHWSTGKRERWPSAPRLPRLTVDVPYRAGRHLSTAVERVNEPGGPVPDPRFPRGTARPPDECRFVSRCSPHSSYVHSTRGASMHAATGRSPRGQRPATAVYTRSFTINVSGLLIIRGIAAHLPEGSQVLPDRIRIQRAETRRRR